MVHCLNDKVEREKPTKLEMPARKAQARELRYICLIEALILTALNLRAACWLTRRSRREINVVKTAICRIEEQKDGRV